MIDDVDDAEIVSDDLKDRPDIDQRYLVPGLSRGLSILQLFSRDRSEMKLADLAEAAGLSRSAAFRLVYTLEKEGYLYRDPTSRRFRLTSKVLSLGFVYLYSRPLTEVVYPYLRRVSIATRTAAHLIQLDGTYVVYLARVAPPVTLVSNLQVGTRLPAHATASGRMLLAGLDDQSLAALHDQMRRDHKDLPPPPLKELTRRAHEDSERGYVMSTSLFEPSVASFAAPVRDGTGTVVAAINVVGPHGLMESVGDAAEFDKVVGQEARDLSSAIGYPG